MNVMFLYADKHRSLLQIDIIILMGLARHAQSIWQISMSLWHLKKEARNEVRELFAPADSNTTIYNML